MVELKDIPQEWVKRYIDQLLTVAGELPVGSPMRDAMLERADHAMDMVEAFRKGEGQ